MDTYKTILFKNLPEFDDIAFPKISEADSMLFTSYVELFASLQEVQQLYDIFRVNVNAFSPYNLQIDDRIIEISSGEEIDRYTINSLTINLISSGRCLVDMIDVILKNDLSQNYCDEFRDEFSSTIYDNTFGYRFLYWLRNISQHGYIPVSRKFDGRYCFDLEQIRNLRHFCYNNKSFIDEIDKIKSEIINVYQNEPDLCFSKNIDDYIKSVIEIYYRFLDFIKPEIDSVFDKVQKCIISHPEYVCRDDRCQGYIAYKKENKTLHLFNVEDNLKNYYLRNRSQVKRVFKNYDRDFHTELKPSHVSEKNKYNYSLERQKPIVVYHYQL